MKPFQKQTLPSLPYDYSDLEPVISAEIMELHHKKHHNAYVNNYNNLLDQFLDAADKNDVGKMIALQAGLRFNGGGHVNHSIFWTNLAPPSKGGGKLPEGELLKAINRDFGSPESLIDQFNAKTAVIPGSGWGWLGYNAGHNRLVIETCPNQDPLTMKGLIPLLGIDVWEHAYYLDYKNARPAYLKEIWNVVNWENVAQRFHENLAEHLQTAKG